jgi:hypothetical protein
LIGDRWKYRRDVDRLSTTASDVEDDDVGTCVCIGVDDGLTE